MKLTIGIPVYNQANYLPEAIESAISQTIFCEIIVCIDGSPDDSVEIAKKYEPRIKVIYQVNKGLASARNTLIMNMTGDYFLPLDADDILLPHSIETIQKVISKTNADVVGLSFKEFGISNATVVLGEVTKENIKQGNRLGYCSAIKREVLLECGGYSPRMTWGYEDYHLWFDLLARGKNIITIPEVLWLYRTKEKSMITEAVKHNDELMAQIYKDFPYAKS